VTNLLHMAHRTPTTADVLPFGARVIPLTPQADGRGALTELFRQEWRTGFDLIQFNLVESDARVLRGVHLHVRHDDYLVLARGRATIGLDDLREGSPTEGQAATIEQHGPASGALLIPHGVAHGFYFHEPSIHVYGVSHYWDLDDELACRWNDAALGIAWPDDDPIVSERDASAGSLAALRTQISQHQPIR
jgi:dTDP-4-dehydrorhamnose 3,5-epimerase